MDFKADARERTGSDEQVGQMLREILSGLKTKMVQPVIEENWKLSAQLTELKEEAQARTAEMKGHLAEIMARLTALENGLREVPLVVLAAIRDAINQAGKES